MHICGIAELQFEDQNFNIFTSWFDVQVMGYMLMYFLYNKVTLD